MIPLGRVLPDPLDQLLLRAHIIGNIAGPLGQLFPGVLAGLGLERLEVQIQRGITLQQERQPLTVAGKQLHKRLSGGGSSTTPVWAGQGPAAVTRTGTGARATDERVPVAGYLPEVGGKRRRGDQAMRWENLVQSGILI